MSTPNAHDPADSTVAATDHPVTAEATGSPDPITGEPGAHPVGVGVGALSAGAAGAAIGSIAGPIGVVIGAAIGAVAGGLAGKEVAATNDLPAAETATTAAVEPPPLIPVDAPTPITMGAMPGEGFRATSGSAFSGEADLPSSEAPASDVEDDALPTPAHASVSASGLQAPLTPFDDGPATPAPAAASESGFQAPAVSETMPLAGAMVSAGGEEAVRMAAYYLYLERHTTGRPGDEVGDWLDAEHTTTK